VVGVVGVVVVGTPAGTPFGCVGTMVTLHPSTALTTVAPARSSAQMKRSATSSQVRVSSAAHPDRSAENEAGEIVASMMWRL